MTTFLRSQEITDSAPNLWFYTAFRNSGWLGIPEFGVSFVWDTVDLKDRLWAHSRDPQGAGVRATLAQGSDKPEKPHRDSSLISNHSRLEEPLGWLGPAAPTSPGNLLDMQIAGPYFILTESETLGVWAQQLGFNKPSRRFWCMLKFKNHSFRTQSFASVGSGVCICFKSQFREGLIWC